MRGSTTTRTAPWDTAWARVPCGTTSAAASTHAAAQTKMRGEKRTGTSREKAAFGDRPAPGTGRQGQAPCATYPDAPAKAGA
jgi:hypothetical protein